ncbi:hypothetical protein DV735_g5811, partial [Chaetothyriales sp. CBS 134920]
MSLTAALRPSTLFSLNGPTLRDESASFHHDAAYVALKRRLLHYQHLILLTPAPGSGDPAGELTPLQRQIQAELWSPLPYHRAKWLHNIEGARNLLLQLERTGRNVKVQRARQEIQKDLAQKRVVIKRLRTRVEEIGREVDALGSESWKLPLPDVQGETAWDILQQARRQEALEEAPPTQAERVLHADAALREGKPVERVLEEIVGDKRGNPEGQQQQQDHQQDPREALFSSSGALRRRGGGEAEAGAGQQQQHPADQATASGSSTTGLSTNERALIDSSRTQEALTTSMISMAVQLKQQAQAFQFSLQQDKGLLDRALEGLDKNLTGMQAAGKNMQFLQRMSEEQGWFGRLKLYALIMGMWAIAILLVFAGPKLRF